MKNLIDDLIAIFEAGIVAGTISAKKVFKGLQDAPALAAVTTQFPYIMVDDGGERVEDPATDSGYTSETRIYSIVIEMGTYSANTNLTQALDDLLDLSNEVKTAIEAEANRLKDSHVWGIVITPFAWDEDRYFFRGRQVVVDFIELTDRFADY